MRAWRIGDVPARYPIILRHDDGTAVLSSTYDQSKAGLSVPCHCDMQVEA
ncbi:hypothetical protein [Agromyces sp. Root81]|nr:hypothetical protein [Agromyces sp. Root81]